MINFYFWLKICDFFLSFFFFFFSKDFTTEIWVQSIVFSNIQHFDQISLFSSAEFPQKFDFSFSFSRLIIIFLQIKPRFEKKSARLSIKLNLYKSTEFDMNDLKKLRASMKRKKEQTVFDRNSNMQKITFANLSHKKKKIKFLSNNIFRFLSEELRVKIKSDENMIVLSFMPFLLSKTSFKFTFSRISAEVFHDEAPSVNLRGNIIKNRTEKIAFMNSKINNEIQQIAFFDDYEKLCSSDYIIFF